jgi:hypothetical protein
VAICHDRLLYLAINLLLDAIGGRHKAVKSRELEQQTDQANAAGAHFGTDQVNGDNQAMQKGKPWGTAKKGDNSRVLVEALVIGPPSLKGAARNLKRLGCLTQGESLGVQLTILIEELGALASIPAWVMIIIASVCVLDYGSHSDLAILRLCCVNGSGWRGRPLISTLTHIESLILWAAHGGQVARPMIEASSCM